MLPEAVDKRNGKRIQLGLRTFFRLVKMSAMILLPRTLSLDKALERLIRARQPLVADFLLTALHFLATVLCF